MKKLVLLMAFFAPTAVQAEEKWQVLSGDDIRTALTGKTLQYERAWQDFRESGRTLYYAGQDSWGYWRVQDDQYCSMWPPSDLWACYDMARLGETIRFVGAGGDIVEGIYRDD